MTSPRNSMALITGASAGIGASFAEALASRGRDLILVARSERALTSLAELLQARHRVRVEVVVMDLARAEAAEELVGELGSRGLEVSTLINNAGFGSIGSFVELPLEREIAMIQLNAVTVMGLTRLLLPPMLARGSGQIVNVSSVLGEFPMARSAVYAATKAFVTSFSQAVAEEVRGSGVVVQVLCPGMTDTNFSDHAGYDGGPLKHLGQSPREVVEASLAGLERGKGKVVPGAHNRLGTVASGLGPGSLFARVSKRLIGAGGKGHAAKVRSVDEDES